MEGNETSYLEAEIVLEAISLEQESNVLGLKGANLTKFSPKETKISPWKRKHWI